MYSIKFPTDLSEVKLKDLFTFADLDKANEQLVYYKALELFTDTKKEAVSLLPLDVADKVIKGITKTLASDSTERHIIELDGVRYGRIPNIETISFGEYIEMDTFVTPLANGDIKHEEAFKFLSCLWRPIVEEVNGLYSIEPFTNEYIDSDHWRRFQEHCPADIYAKSSVGFFLNLRIELLQAMQTYFRQAKLADQESNLEKVGDGMEALKLMQQVNSVQLMQPLTTLLQLPSIHLPTMQAQED